MAAAATVPEATVIEMTCRSIVNRTRIPGNSYCLNPYVGCGHGCLYCYAPVVRRRSGDSDDGKVRCKVNAADVLLRQLMRLRPGKILMSTQTDPYQPAEEERELTRSLLLQLDRSPFPLTVLTKSDLVLRDLDVLARPRRASWDVGMSLLPVGERIRCALEPGAPPIERRIEALKTLHKKGVRTWAFLAPMFPATSKDELLALLREIDGAVDHVLVDRLNYKGKLWRSVSSAIAAVSENEGAETVGVDRALRYVDAGRLISLFFEKRGVSTYVIGGGRR